MTLACRVTSRDGERLDQALSDNPIVLRFGTEHLVGHADAALLGACVGDTVVAAVPPAEGFGPLHPDRRFDIPRESFPPDAHLAVGTILSAKTGERAVSARVTAIDGDRVYLDSNDPLAGLTLRVAMTVLAIESADTE